jgi:hypothetical protein
LISERRPVRALHILQTLDQRESEQGKLSLDINAKGEGLIPDLHSIFESIQLSGFDLTIADQPNSVGEFKTENGKTVAASERNWQLTYRRRTDLQGDARFKFPAKRQDLEAQIEYKRFEDADLITLTEADAARGFLFSRAKDRAAWWTFAGITAMLLAAAGRHWVRTRGANPPATTNSLPEVITPFTTLAHLRSALDGAPSVGERERIATAIAELEKRCFSVQPNPPDTPELRSILLAHMSQPHAGMPLQSSTLQRATAL